MINSNKARKSGIRARQEGDVVLWEIAGQSYEFTLSEFAELLYSAGQVGFLAALQKERPLLASELHEIMQEKGLLLPEEQGHFLQKLEQSLLDLKEKLKND